MKIFETNSGLGYGEVAYFIKTNEGEMLCIYENEDQEIFWKKYKVGNIYEFEDYELDEVIESKHEIVLKQSGLYNSFLFNEFLKGLNN